MARAGMIVAQEHGQQLPVFGSLEEARSVLFRERDQLLALLVDCARDSKDFACTFEPESLKALEGWYFRLVDTGVPLPTLSQLDFERCIAMYFGELLVRSSPSFEWFVSEYVFAPGRYELGIKRGLVSIMLSKPMRPQPRERNRRMQSLWRDFARFAR